MDPRAADPDVFLQAQLQYSSGGARGEAVGGGFGFRKVLVRTKPISCKNFGISCLLACFEVEKQVDRAYGYLYPTDVIRTLPVRSILRPSRLFSRFARPFFLRQPLLHDVQFIQTPFCALRLSADGPGPHPPVLRSLP